MPSSSSSAEQFAREIEAVLTPLANAERAPAMRDYMRRQFDFLGLAMPVRRAAALPLLRAHKTTSGDDLVAMAYCLWALPQREFHYTAIDLLARHWRSLHVEHVPDLLTLARQKSWWDSVDGLAGIVGDIMRAAGPKEQIRMDEALHDENLWVRRIAMLHQLGWREQTDTERLFSYALTLAPEEEFFIRKAIGWALRDYAWHDPTRVRSFLHEAGERLSPLTRREAAKNLSRLTSFKYER